MRMASPFQNARSHGVSRFINRETAICSFIDAHGLVRMCEYEVKSLRRVIEE